MGAQHNAARLRGRSVEVCVWFCLGGGLSGCLDGAAQAPLGSSSLALSQSFAPTDDTFINSNHADNNNGASPSIFTGKDGQGGVMRGLIRFAMPAGLQGRVTVSNVQLKMTLRQIGLTAGNVGTAATQSLQAVSESWVQGNGFANTQMTFVVGQACGGSVSGATWNQELSRNRLGRMQGTPA
jgi:hypothetical protein